MCRRVIVILVVLSIISLSPLAFASDDSELILKLLIKKGVITQAEVDEMKAEIAKEKTAVKAEVPKTFEERLATVEKDLLSKVGLDKISSKLKIKGRAAVGYLKSEKRGSYPAGSFEVPDAKIQFAFQPDEINTFVMRFNLNNATAQSPLLDYFYLQSKDFLPFLKKTPFSLNGRLGRFKLGFGEETWSDNPVESILPSKSAAGASVIDEGLELAGEIKLDKIGLRPLGWVASVSDGNSGVGTDLNSPKAFMGKLYYTPIDPLYLSASYYHSGQLDTASSEMSIGGITAPPTNTLRWTRQVVEGDIRYDFKKGKVLNPPAYCDSLAFVRFAYGHFMDTTDSISGSATKIDREGNYGFAEGMYNITKKLYAAGRASFVGLNGIGNTASFNSITANLYERYSFGLGYRLSSATILKASYDINLERKGTGGEDPKDNLFSAIISSSF